MSEPKFDRPKLKVGDTIWWSWSPVKITGETARSWIHQWAYNAETKFPKRRSLASPEYFISQQEVDDDKMLRASYAISDKVRYCQDVALLRQIATLVGYTPQP